MNDTTRDELIERIAELADQFACGAAGEPVVYALHGPMDFAEEVIDLVTAARDAEIREALESEELVGMFARMLWTQDDKPTAAPSSSYYMAARYNLDSIAKHIGLGDSDTGGQG